MRDIENGTRSPTLQTLLVLSACLAGLDREQRPVALADLVRSDHAVLVTERTSVPPADLAGFLQGEPVALPALEEDLPDPALLPGPAPDEERLREVVRGFQLADERAAKRLGVSDGVAQLLMARSLGGPLSGASTPLFNANASSRQQKAAATRYFMVMLSQDLKLSEAWSRALPDLVERSRTLSQVNWGQLMHDVGVLAELAAEQGMDAAAAAAHDAQTVHEWKLAAVPSVPWLTTEHLLSLTEEVARGDGQ